jgi:hypothetical protein
VAPSLLPRAARTPPALPPPLSPAPPPSTSESDSDSYESVAGKGSRHIFSGMEAYLVKSFFVLKKHINFLHLLRSLGLRSRDETATPSPRTYFRELVRNSFLEQEWDFWLERGLNISKTFSVLILVPFLYSGHSQYGLFCCSNLYSEFLICFFHSKNYIV